MVDKETRLEKLRSTLLSTSEPVTGSELATMFGVTRQVVVHDIALLRAEGLDVVSTPRGYWVHTVIERGQEFILSVCHPPELTAIELYTLVDYGIHVNDVQVEHPVYGELRGSLHIASRRDVDLFLARLAESGAALLSALTEGQHMHNVEAPDDKRMLEAVAKLRHEGIQVFD